MTQTDTRGGVAAVLIRFSLPLIISGILQQLYNWADAFIVGHAPWGRAPWRQWGPPRR